MLRTLILPALLLALTAPAPAFGATVDTPAAPAVQSGPAEESTEPQAAAKPALGFEAKIQGILDQERDQVAALRARILEATDPSVRLSLQREIDLIKQAAEIELMVAQRDRAQDEGRTDQVRELEEILAGLRETMDQARERHVALSSTIRG